MILSIDIFYFKTVIIGGPIFLGEIIITYRFVAFLEDWNIKNNNMYFSCFFIYISHNELCESNENNIFYECSTNLHFYLNPFSYRIT